uniref:Uncharacterized protein n=1 Tax=Anguilla anguilla TaxID=7936 RepID=A0A0E9WMW6_ANGAN
MAGRNLLLHIHPHLILQKQKFQCYQLTVCDCGGGQSIGKECSCDLKSMTLATKFLSLFCPPIPTSIQLSTAVVAVPYKSFCSCFFFFQYVMTICYGLILNV